MHAYMLERGIGVARDRKAAQGIYLANAIHFNDHIAQGYLADYFENAGNHQRAKYFRDLADGRKGLTKQTWHI